MQDNKFVAVGDIHGCVKSLDALLEKLVEFDDRTFIFMGDYIDRGPSSRRVVDLLIAFSHETDCIFLRGNHEQMLLDAYLSGDLDLWLMNGGKTTISSYEDTYDNLIFPENHLKFYHHTRLYYDTEDYFFVHAGISPSKTIAESLQDENKVQTFLWERSHLNAFETPWEKTVVFGHTPRPHPIRKPRMLGIDTGCVYDSLGYGKLTAVALPEQEFIQQICLDN